MVRQRRNTWMARSAYIGSGNKFSVLSRKPRSPFGQLRALYGEGMERYQRGDESLKLSPMTPEQKEELKMRIRRYVKKQRRESVWFSFISMFVTLLVAYLVYLGVSMWLG